jgi:hypothetical protein
MYSPLTNKTKKENSRRIIIACIGSIGAVLLLATRSSISGLDDSRGPLDEKKLNDLYQSDVGCVSRKHNLVYVHVPKTGGTTIENISLFEDGGLHHSLTDHQTIDVMMKDSEDRALTDFATAAHIRHPCERYISAFHYLKDGKGNTHDTAWAEEHIGSMSIDEFVQSQREKNWPGDDHYTHFNEMHPFLFHSNGEFGIDHLLCQEQWDEGIARLYSSVGMPTPDYLLNSSKDVTNKKPNHARENKHESCADLQPETRQAIEEKYAMDYCVFGYASIPSSYQLTETCIGLYLTKSEFTKNYGICKAQMTTSSA